MRYLILLVLLAGCEESWAVRSERCHERGGIYATMNPGDSRREYTACFRRDTIPMGRRELPIHDHSSP